MAGLEPLVGTRRFDGTMRRMPFDFDVVLIHGQEERQVCESGPPASGVMSASGIDSSRMVPAATAAAPAPRGTQCGARDRQSQNRPVRRPRSWRTENRTPCGLKELQAELIAFAEEIHQRPLAVQTDVQGLAVEPELEEPQDRRAPVALVHRPGRVAHLQEASAEPLEVASSLRRPGPAPAARRAGARVAGGAPAEMLLTNSSSGIGLPEQPIDVPEVAPEQVVELEVVLRRMIVAVPPEPVAAFGDEHFLARPGRPRPRRHSASRRASRASAS